MERLDCVVVGAGVIGLSAARALARAGREVVVLEAAVGCGMETSSRNSEVIHGGLYYAAGSLMARSCVEGRRLLYRYCEERGIAFSNCGKLVVSTSADEEALLETISRTAEENGVDDLRLLSKADVVALEPDLRCTAALLSPQTGILDSHAYMLSLQADAEAAGATFVFRSPVVGGDVSGDFVELAVGGRDPTTVKCEFLVNAAGLHAPGVAKSIGIDASMIPDYQYAKGNYFSLRGGCPFSRLIYPVPVAGGLGIHLTMDLDGRARFGPDVEWIDEIDYRMDAGPREARFYEAVRRYWPALPDGTLSPDFCGIRPKIAGAAGTRDFIVQGPEEHHLAGVLNYYGIESPGLTASLFLGELAVSKLL